MRYQAKPKASQTLGSYAPNRFLITVDSSHKIATAGGMPLRMSRKELSVFFHEYMHYLQNISTVIGLHEFICSYDMWRLFRETFDKAQGCRGTKALPRQRRSWVKEIQDAGALRDGRTLSTPPARHTAVSFRIGGVSSSLVSKPFCGSSVEAHQVTLSGDVLYPRGQPKQCTYQLGLIAIQESVAFELDQMVARTAGSTAPQPHDAPVFPYKLLRSLRDYYEPSLTTMMLIKLATIAQQTNDPAGVLIDCLGQIKQKVANGSTVASAFLDVQKFWHPQARRYLAAALQDVQTYSATITNGVYIKEAIRIICATFQSSLTARQADLYFDLAPFDSRGQCDFKKLQALIQKHKPCLVLQEGDGDETVVGRDTLFAFSPLPKRGIDPEAALRTFHSALYLMLIHSPKRGFTPTHPSVAGTCPFFTSCRLPLRRNDPDICQYTPWDAASWAGWKAGLSCNYGSACSASVGL